MSLFKSQKYCVIISSCNNINSTYKNGREFFPDEGQYYDGKHKKTDFNCSEK